MKDDDRVGTSIADSFYLDRVLGRGGFGAVYAGFNTRTGQPVAVKLLGAELAADPELLARFLQEAKAAAGLSHPNVVEVLEVGQDDGVAYLVLELLEGEPLSERLGLRQRLSVEDTLRLLLPVMDAVALAHERGIIHRDLKPANIFLARGPDGVEIPKLLDFGVAKLLEGSDVSTRTGSVIGTPGYMSPEQLRGVGRLTPAADVWGMGVVAFRALTGELPVEPDPNPTLMLMDILQNPRPKIRSIEPKIPPRLAEVLDATLLLAPEHRPQNMGALLQELIVAAAEDGIEPLPRPHLDDDAGSSVP